jgi:hypothetical protein
MAIARRVSTRSEESLLWYLKRLRFVTDLPHSHPRGPPGGARGERSKRIARLRSAAWVTRVTHVSVHSLGPLHPVTQCSQRLSQHVREEDAIAVLLERREARLAHRARDA